MVAHPAGLLVAEDEPMLHIFTCPECRTEHAEPAEAHFLLAVLCVDCAYEIEYRAPRLAASEIRPAA